MRRAALLALATLFGVALAAPLLASGEPLLVLGRWPSSPWLHALFDANANESALDRAYNALLVTSPLALFVRRAPRGVLALALCAVGLAVLAPARAPRVRHEGPALHALVAHGPHDSDLSAVRAPPSAAHPLGTDSAGRDVFARLVWGARPSLTIGVLAVALYMALGTLLGALAGWYGGRVDLVIQRGIEVMMSIPSLFLALAIAALLPQRSFFHLMLVIALVGWTTPARLVRAELLRLRNLDYVLAARAAGTPERVILWRELLPGALGPLWVTATFGVGSAILFESALSFLGLGDPLLPSWGQLLAAGRATHEWRMIVPPGLAIFFTVGALQLLGDSLSRRAR